MTATPKVAVIQIGARRHYAVPRILQDADMLDCLYTDVCASTGLPRILDSVIPQTLRPKALKGLLDRRIDGVPPRRIHAFPCFGFKRALQRRTSATPADLLRQYLVSNEEFGRLVAGRGIGQANAVYAFNAAALEVFRYGKDRSMRLILDQTTVPWQIEESLLAEERKRWPGWEFEGTRREDWMPLSDREHEEWNLADLIVCGSQFVADGIRNAGGPADKCTVVPYGVDIDRFRLPVRQWHDGPLHVLFAGTIQLRKGIQYLMQAAGNLNPAEIRVRAAGPVRVSPEAQTRLEEHIELAGPSSRFSIQEEYAWAHVLVLPSLSEGSANVCYEALASGLPVITTPNAGSVVRDGREGYIVPVRSAEAIAQRLQILMDDRDLLQQMSANAIQRAKQYDMTSYAQRLLEVIKAMQVGK